VVAADGYAELHLIEDVAADGCKTVRVPSVEQIVDWMFAYSSGEAPKVGSKESRAGPQYATINGVSQADQFMSGAAKAFGYGCYADSAPALKCWTLCLL